MNYKRRDGYKQFPSVTKSVNALHDAAAAADIWTPASGKKFVLQSYSLTAYVGVTLQAAAAGDRVVIYDHVVTAPIAVIGVVLVALPFTGSVLSSGAQCASAFAPAAATAAQAGPIFAPVREEGLWYVASAADNVLRAALVVSATGAVVNVGTGELRIIGTVAGHEEG